jgi:hypothetical protein
MERYSIQKDHAIGKVLWHSLNEGGDITVYDVKFGNTVVRNLLSEDLDPVLVQEHKHFKRDDDDDNRKIKEEWEGDAKIKQLDKYGKDEMTKGELCDKRDALKDKEKRTAKQSKELRRINFAIRSRKKGKKFGKVDC